METDVAVKLLRNIVYRSSRDSRIADAIASYSESTTEREYLKRELETSQVELIFLLDRLQVELGSFVNNDLGMLTLTEELKTAIREQELPCHQAKIINKLSAKTLSGTNEQVSKMRSEALDYVLKSQLSVGKTRSYINQIIAEHGKPKSTSNKKTKQNYQQLKTELQKLPVSKLTKTQLNSLKSVMEKQLAAIEQKLKD